MIITIWSTFAYLSIPLRPLLGEAFLPVFYFLVWLSGLILNPSSAFFTSFLGHCLFDLVSFFSPLFIFIWFASGLCSFAIAIVRDYKIGLLIMTFLMPIIYFLHFWAMGTVIFYENIHANMFYYFKAFPIVFIMLVFVNPIFNWCVYKWFVQNPSFINLQNILLQGEFKNKNLSRFFSPK